MPSSTSNFERPVPGGSWGRTWLAALLLAVAALVSLEIVFRQAGHRPSVVDDAALWSLRRSQVYDQGQRSPVVLLGSSRMQLGFVPAELESRYPEYRAVQLAVDGRGPLATLGDLALDKKFHGIVICAVSEVEWSRNRWDDQAPYVAYYHTQFSINTAWNTRIKCYLQSKIALMYPTLRPDEVLLCLARDRALPVPLYVRTFADRSRIADYSQVNVAEHRRIRVETAREACGDGNYVSPEQWQAEMTTIEQYVQSIQSRGGQVILVRYPTTDELWQLDESSYPRAYYWDVFARRTSAVAIHFQDFLELTSLHCPDESHLDYPDAVAFTRVLLRMLEERQILHRQGYALPEDTACDMGT